MTQPPQSIQSNFPCSLVILSNYLKSKLTYNAESSLVNKYLSRRIGLKTFWESEDKIYNKTTTLQIVLSC